MSHVTASSTEVISLQADLSMPEVVVRNWPLIDGGWRGVFGVAATLGIGLLSLYQSGSSSMALCAIGAVTLAMWRFWLPVEYHIHRRGINERCLFWHRTIGWRHVNGCRMLSRGAILNCRPDSDNGPERICFIEWHRQQAAVMDALSFYCGTAVSADSKDF